MDKKKKISNIKALFISLLLVWAFPSLAQDVNKISFGDKHYEDSIGCDRITLLMKVLDANDKNCNDVFVSDINKHFDLIENEVVIPKERWSVKLRTEGQRIPGDYTISVLVDLGIPRDGKIGIYEAVQSLVESAQDSCVYLSFFGDYVSNSHVVTKENYKEFENRFQDLAQNKYFYSALYAKLAEFNDEKFLDEKFQNNETLVKAQNGYRKERSIYERASAAINDGSSDAINKNLLFIFTGGNEFSTMMQKTILTRIWNELYWQSLPQKISTMNSSKNAGENISPQTILKQSCSSLSKLSEMRCMISSSLIKFRKTGAILEKK